MKKIVYSILTGICFFALFSSCERDNFDAPSASFYGAIKDSVGGGLVETELINGSQIEVFEKGGYATPVSQKWLIKNNGEFRNDLVFANVYDINLANGNFFPYRINDVEIKPGQNQRDFQVVPYIRIKNCVITHDKAANKIVATFSLEAGKSRVKAKAIRLYAFTDIYVGENVKFNTTGTGFTQSFSPSKIIDATTYTLSIDLAANSSLLKPGRNYYFRVGALADVSGVGTVRHNFAPYVKIAL
ncbi:MAG: DUF3823 domain-containing protein [Prolixibacteraceae bacterium]|nr:DUF3823 domain-containing protein [Prolixibacteraceae bacterium]